MNKHETEIFKEMARMTGVDRYKVAREEHVVKFMVPLGQKAEANRRWSKGWPQSEWDFKKKFGIDEDIHIRIGMLAEPVRAKLGDFVLVVDDWAEKEEDLQVGIVSSVREVRGRKYYGCRHIVPTETLGNDDSLFKVTDEDYGGYPSGFYRVIDRKTAMRLVSQQVRAAVKKMFKEANEDLAEIEDSIGTILDAYKYKKAKRFVSYDDSLFHRNLHDLG